MSNNQHLFLIEFVVDQINIPSVRAINENILPSATYISFQILNLPLINIYQDDNSSRCICSKNEIQIFRKGKSCLFALPTSALEQPLYTFPITMSVFKKFPPGVLPDVILIGSHQIEVKDLINAILKEQIFKNGNCCKTMKDTFKITTGTGQFVGNATVFIRISCFGKNIITHFQIPRDKEPYIFKSTDDNTVFTCEEIQSCSKLPQSLQEKKSPSKKYSPSNYSDLKKNHIGQTRLNDQDVMTPHPPPCTPIRLFESHVAPTNLFNSSAANSSRFPQRSDLKKCGCV